MNFPSTYATKSELLEFLREIPKDDLVEVARAVNEDPVNRIQVEEEGTRADIIKSFWPVLKGVTWAGISSVFDFVRASDDEELDAEDDEEVEDDEVSGDEAEDEDEYEDD